MLADGGPVDSIDRALAGGVPLGDEPTKQQQGGVDMLGGGEEGEEEDEELEGLGVPVPAATPSGRGLFSLLLFLLRTGGAPPTAEMRAPMRQSLLDQIDCLTLPPVSPSFLPSFCAFQLCLVLGDRKIRLLF